MTNDAYVGWVTATCKKCKKAFMMFDKRGKYNDEPPTQFFCDECKALGFKNVKKKVKKDPNLPKGKQTPEEFLKENEVKDKIVCREFKKIVKRYKGRRLYYHNILKEAIEIAGYIREEQNG